MVPIPLLHPRSMLSSNSASPILRLPPGIVFQIATIIGLTQNSVAKLPARVVAYLVPTSGGMLLPVIVMLVATISASLVIPWCRRSPHRWSGPSPG